jgi:uncharacterized protein
MSDNLKSNDKKFRGFATMDRNVQRKIAASGGTAAHAGGNAHKWTPDEARAAALKGHAKRRQDKLKINTDQE